MSIAKKDRKGLSGERSGLFWEYVRILHDVKPKYFILENVASMPAEAKQIITETLGVQPIMIDAALVSAQRRKRLFWTNIPGVVLPEDREIFLKDILEQEVDEKYYISDATLQTILEKMRQGKPIAQAFRIHETNGKSVTLSSGGGGTGAKTGLYAINPDGSEKLKSNTLRTSSRDPKFGDKHNWDQILVVPEATKKGYAIAQDGDSVDLSFPSSKTRRGRVGDKVKNLMTSQNINVFVGGRVRKLTPIECDRLQSLPDNYTEGGYTILQKEDIFSNMVSWKQIVSSKDVIERKKQISVPVSCIIKDILAMEISNCQSELLENVIFAIDHKSQKECVISITKTGNGMEMLNIPIILGENEEIDQTNLDILKNAAKDIVLYIETSWRRLSEESSQELISCIISTMIKLIIDRKIYTSAKNQSTTLYIVNLKKLLENSSNLELLSLKMGRIGKISDSQRYKCLGNAFNAEVIAHILKHAK